jgi:chemotaxis protein MotB
MEKGAQPLIIKKRKGHRHGHHGGSWKVALADFMTALMAFFLLMWLLGNTSPEEQKAIAAHFNDPGSKYVVGEGGADLGLINQERPLEQTQSENPNDERANDESVARNLTDEELQKEIERIEAQQLEDLKNQLETEINSLDSVFQQIKDQILIDFTALGLRIQIVDKDQRPMFDIGSANLQKWSRDVLHALAPILDKVQNKISVTGHTDSKPYGAGATYTNWELSADRANAARRALLEGTYPEAKVATVQGMGSAAPLLVDKPGEPINRRIAIIVLKKAVADALGSGVGIDSSQLMKGSSDTYIPSTPVPPTPVAPQQRLLSPSEVDDAIDAASSR